MIVDITNEVLDRLKTELTTCTVLTAYPKTTPNFPCVIVEEKINNSHNATRDSGGFHHSEVSIEINIYTNSMNKMTEAKTLRGLIDAIVSDEYGLSRDFSGTVPNYLDTNIYRYTLRYSATVDINKTIYGR